MSKYLDHLKKCQTNKKMIHSTKIVSKMISHIEAIEGLLWEKYHKEACDDSASVSDAVDIANQKIEEIGNAGREKLND